MKQAMDTIGKTFLTLQVNAGAKVEKPTGMKGMPMGMPGR